MPFCVDLWLHGEQQLVAVAVVEQNETNGSESKDQRCDARVCDSWRVLVRAVIMLHATHQ